MKKLISLILLLMAAGRAEAGSVQFSTYYPSPFGMYDRLRLVPRTAILTACDAATLGTLYVDQATGALTYCNISGAWGPLAGGPWTQDINGVYVTDTTANVGIGTTDPTLLSWNKLSVVSDTAGAWLALKGVGDAYDYSALVLWSDEVVDRRWVLSHRKFTGEENNFVIEEFNGASYDQRLVIRPGGNIGIGTTTPSQKLHVESATGTNIVSSITTDITGTQSAGFYARTFSGVFGSSLLSRVLGENAVGTYAGLPNAKMTQILAAGADYFVIGAEGTTGSLVFTTNPIGGPFERMRITPSGNVGIGTTNPGTNKLEVVGGPIKATGGLIIPTCTIAAGDCPASPVNGQFWLCTDCP